MYTHLSNVLQCPSSTQNFIFSNHSSHISEKQFSRPHQAPGPKFRKTCDTCECFLKPYLSEKFQVSKFIHSKALAIFKKNSFLGLIRPLVQSLENPETRAKKFLMINLSAKFQVPWYIRVRQS